MSGVYNRDLVASTLIAPHHFTHATVSPPNGRCLAAPVIGQQQENLSRAQSTRLVGLSNQFDRGRGVDGDGRGFP
jgi:hypothetical protein